MSIDLFETGAYFRTGGGNVEGAIDHKIVIEWATWNLDNGSDPKVEGLGIEKFAKARTNWSAAGIQHFPWLHCHSIDDVRRLIAAAKTTPAPAIGLNIEDVFSDKLNLEQVASEVKSTWGGPVHMVTLPWVQNGQGWHHLDFAVAGLGIFSETGEQASTFPNGYDPKVVDDCIVHAFAEGLKHVTLMFDAKRPCTRELYGEDFKICHSLYTGDDIGHTTSDWTAWDYNGELVKLTPPQEEVPKVPDIGDQDGIRASMNRLRALDPGGTIVPQGSTIDDLTQPVKNWKAWDKLERTLQILKDDHDASN